MPRCDPMTLGFMNKQMRFEIFKMKNIEKVHRFNETHKRARTELVLWSFWMGDLSCSPIQYKTHTLPCNLFRCLSCHCCPDFNISKSLKSFSFISNFERKSQVSQKKLLKTVQKQKRRFFLRKLSTWQHSIFMINMMNSKEFSPFKAEKKKQHKWNIKWLKSSFCRSSKPLLEPLGRHCV